uniref:V-crk sarcoma virus CT10 oncogene homolog (Avian)-like n=1 Tax=Pan troglodytes TaxID=9598 RepID=K7BL55_PANTR
MAEDHGLSNGDGPVEVTQGLELLVSAAAQDIVLLDGVQGLFLTLQFDNVWVWDHFLGKLPHRVFKGGREKQHLAVPGQHPLDADALILVALSGYHDISLIQNKHLDFLGINELELGAPVQHGPRGANDNLLTDLLASFQFIASNSIS